LLDKYREKLGGVQLKYLKSVRWPSLRRAFSRKWRSPRYVCIHSYLPYRCYDRLVTLNFCNDSKNKLENSAWLYYRLWFISSEPKFRIAFSLFNMICAGSLPSRLKKKKR